MQETWKMNAIQEMNYGSGRAAYPPRMLGFHGTDAARCTYQREALSPESGRHYESCVLSDALSPLRDDRRLSRCDGVRHPSLPRPTHNAYMPAGQLKTRFKKLLHRLYISSFHGRLLRQVGRRGCTSLPCQSVSFACISAGSLLREGSMRVGLFAAGYTWEALLNNPSE